jgi:hypothetical protein
MALYHKSDIGYSGVISKIEFLSSADGQSVSYSYFDVLLGYCPNDTLDLTFSNNYDQNGSTEVYYGNPSFTANQNEWVPIEFLTNFPYKSGNNLIIDVKWSGCAHTALYTYVTNTKGINSIACYNGGINAEYASYSMETANVIRLTMELTNVENTSVGVLKALYK